MQIRLIVPNVIRGNTPIERYGGPIADIAGGFTATQGTGGWVDNDDFLYTEPVTVFDVSCRYKTDKGTYVVPRLRTLARRIARELSQDCIYLSIDGHVEYVTK